MAITEQIILPLEGEQWAVFQGLDAQEKAIVAQRNAMVQVILAGKGLLASLRESPNAIVQVDEQGIIVTPPPTD